MKVRLSSQRCLLYGISCTNREANRIALIGPIRQELLSDIRHTAQFVKVRDKLRYFPDTVLTETDYELAAKNYNACKQEGIQGSTDFLICAVAMRYKLDIITLDYKC